MDTLIVFIIQRGVMFLGGCLWGLIPLFMGRKRGRPNLGLWGLLCSGFAGMFSLTLLAVVGFVIAILAMDHDVRPMNTSSPRPATAARPVTVPAPAYHSRDMLTLVCLAGPMRGQRYRIGPDGLMIGRDSDCSVRFAPDARGISRHHCTLRWQQDVLVLVDLNSACGTFLGDGRQLPPNYPTTVTPGTRFYLGSTAVLFQVSNG